jgi:hypothetical protein
MALSFLRKADDLYGRSSQREHALLLMLHALRSPYPALPSWEGWSAAAGRDGFPLQGASRQA